MAYGQEVIHSQRAKYQHFFLFFVLTWFGYGTKIVMENDSTKKVFSVYLNQAIILYHEVRHHQGDIVCWSYGKHTRYFEPVSCRKVLESPVLAA